MSFWDSIGDAFSSAVSAVESAGESIAKKVAAATVSGANLFTDGWKKVFSGDFQTGISEIGMGLAKAAGFLPPGVTGDTYADIVGEISKQTMAAYTQTQTKTCFTAYREQVKNALARNGLTWNDSMNDPLTAGARQMFWIDMGC